MKPNVILIICDALRPKDMSLYGYKIETDKNIKKIGSESIVFEKNFTVSNASDPSLTSIFSGNYTETHGFKHQNPFMREEEINKLRKNKFWLPLYLKKEGYRTISATPLYLWFKKGFDYYKKRETKGTKKLLNNPIIKRFLLALPNWAYRLGKRMFKARASPHFYPAKEIVDLAISKINEDSKEFFLFMHLVDTHYPYPSAEKTNTEGKTTVNKILSQVSSSVQREYIKKRFYDIQADSLEEIKIRRDQSIGVVDKELGRLYSFLKNKKLLDNTIFIILSDHGDNFGEHNTYLCRGGLYDASVHVPLIMHIPGILPKRISELTQTIDIAPTILELIGDKKTKMDGKSLLKLIKTGKPVRKKVLFNDGYSENGTAERTKLKKIIYSDGSKCYLCGAVHSKQNEEYDLIKDPEELNNKAAN